MELRTLKEINQRIYTNENTNKFVNQEIRKNLRREAVKHIKKLQKENQILEGINKNWNNGKINWIKSFFNIKEKDLL